MLPATIYMAFTNRWQCASVSKFWQKMCENLSVGLDYVAKKQRKTKQNKSKERQSKQTNKRNR